MSVNCINAIILIISSFFFSYFYIMSVQPASLEKKMSILAYRKCRNLRIAASLFEMIAVMSYIIYRFYPLDVGIPQSFGWSYWISFIIALVVGIPSSTVMILGIKDAGEEALSPRKEHTMYGGIYRRIRHPQALGEVFLWFVVAFLLNSLHLVIYSLVWFPVFYLFCVMEEKDLVVRFGEKYMEYKRKTGMFFPK